jgi:hypothetical protein
MQESLFKSVRLVLVLLWLMLAKPRFLRFLGDIVRNKIAENMKIFVKID